jgi:S1-C subfamily serine protease
VFLIKSTYQPNYGIKVIDFDSETRNNLKRNTGVLVTLVYFNSYMFNANILEGDVIIGINNLEVRNVDEFLKIIDSIDMNENQINLSILRDGQELSIVVSLN